MNLLTKTFFINHCLRRCSVYYPLNELRLSHLHNYPNDSFSFPQRILNLENFKGHVGLLIPERKFMNSYFGQVVKEKFENAYDTVRYLGRTEDKLLGFQWFRTLDDINYKEFISLLELPDTFYSWFIIVELHTWMLLLNLPQRTRGQKVTRIALISAMWMDTERRAKILAPSNVNFKKNMKSLYHRFQVTLYLYDDAYFSNDRELSSAIWYNFYEKKNVDPRLIEVSVSYIRYQVHYLNKLQLLPEHAREENLKLWTPLAPHYEKVFKSH